jgi:hypothetical protein
MILEFSKAVSDIAVREDVLRISSARSKLSSKLPNQYSEIFSVFSAVGTAQRSKQSCMNHWTACTLHQVLQGIEFATGESHLRIGMPYGPTRRI